MTAPAARIGFIGLGVMGEAMCRNLLTKGCGPVIAHDLNPDPLARLAGEGAETAKTTGALAELCDIVILCLPGGEQVRRLVLEDGLIGRLRPGATLIDMSTSPPALMREIAAEAAARDVRFADAPVARTRQAAADGTLAILVGADAAVFAEIRPILTTMGTDIVHCGDVGAGQIFKIMNNMILFQNVAALAEALTMATRAGVDGGLLLETISKGSGDSFALRNHGMKSLLPGDFPERAFSVRYAAKDLAYAREMAAEFGVRAPGAAHVAALFEEAIEAGEGERYFPVIAKLLTD